MRKVALLSGTILHNSNETWNMFFKFRLAPLNSYARVHYATPWDPQNLFFLPRSFSSGTFLPSSLLVTRLSKKRTYKKKWCLSRCLSVLLAFRTFHSPPQNDDILTAGKKVLASTTPKGLHFFFGSHCKCLRSQTFAGPNAAGTIGSSLKRVEAIACVTYQLNSTVASCFGSLSKRYSAALWIGNTLPA